MRAVLAPFLVFLFVTAQAATAQTTALSPAELRTLAAQYVVNGEPVPAYQMAQALLARDPNDIEAMVIRARAARDLGRLPEAVATARRAWAGATTSNERFASSMVMAQALSSSGSRNRAQFWLRRAAQNAPNEDMKSVAVRDFRLVRRATPWAFELTGGISPNSNINNGSQKETSSLFDLPFEFQLSGRARALSGLEYSMGLSARYRISETRRTQNDLLFQGYHKTYSMTNEAKRQAPTAKGSDFAFSTVSLSYIRRGFSSAEFKMPHQFELTLGKTYYAHTPFMDFFKLGFTQNYVLTPGTHLFAGGTVERQKSTSRRADVDMWSLRAGTSVRTASGDNLLLSLDYQQSESIDAALDYSRTTLRARYAFAKPILGADISMGLSLSHKTHQRSRFSRFGREDQEVTFDVTAVLRQIEYYGFSPSVTVSARRNQSTIGLYDAEGLGLRIGIQSSF